MDLRLSMVQQQKLAMTHEMRQSIDILQMSAVDLMEYLNELLETNPLIEEIKGGSGLGSNAGPKNNSKDPGNEWWLNINTSTDLSLEEVLVEQLRDLCLQPSLYFACLVLVRSLNESGYLDESLDLISKQTGSSLELLEQALDVVQGLEPLGVGAANLEECLLLQIGEDDPRSDLIKRLIRNDLKDIAKRKFTGLAKKYNVSVIKIQEATDQISRLNPRPGLNYGKEKPIYVAPDLIVKNDNGGFEVVLNDSTAPKISFNKDYQKLIKYTACKESSSYLQEKWATAKWISRCIQQRKVTLINVARTIFEIQRNFCEYGPSQIKPMQLKNIAHKLDMHESTVSRAVKGKYVLTPWGLYELKHFFSTSISKVGEESASALQLKEKVREIIAEEDSTSPLSDQKIADMLQNMGFVISRRTVTKYRESLNIGSTIHRKRYTG